MDLLQKETYQTENHIPLKLHRGNQYCELLFNGASTAKGNCCLDAVDQSHSAGSLS